MKFIPELLLSIFLHPIAVVLLVLNVLSRDDMSGFGKLFWLLFGVIGWGIGPVLYVTIGGGDLW